MPKIPNSSLKDKSVTAITGGFSQNATEDYVDKRFKQNLIAYDEARRQSIYDQEGEVCIERTIRIKDRSRTQMQSPNISSQRIADQRGTSIPSISAKNQKSLA